LILKKVFDFYINSSLHVALAVVSFTVITYLNFGVVVNYELLVFIFLATITGYNFIKYAEIAKFRHLNLSPELRAIQIFSFLVFVGLMLSLFFQSISVLIASCFLGFFTLLYALPFLGRHRKLREIPGLKIYIIALVVAGVTVLLPLLESEIFPTSDHFIDFFQRTIIAVVLILPFEIRDMNKDIVHLSTIPQQLGVRRTRQLGYLLIAVFLITEFLKTEIDINYAISLAGLGILSGIYLKISNVDKGKYFASFWVEAAPMFWIGIYYLVNIII